MLPADLIAECQSLHTDSRRGYHAWSHPLALLALLPEVDARLFDSLAVECAILLHDAVYDPQRSDNECQSAKLARRLLSGRVPTASLERTIRLIEATERHLVPEGLAPEEAQDTRIFLDMDLSILGAAAGVFDAYEAGVRHEYSHVHEAAFRSGRAAILERFLVRDRLYLSDWGHGRFEAAARLNLKRSLDRLRAGQPGALDP
jgi:predicted metal-dependent HD superfamily phosphohydrolase